VVHQKGRFEKLFLIYSLSLPLYILYLHPTPSLPSLSLLPNTFTIITWDNGTERDKSMIYKGKKRPIKVSRKAQGSTFFVDRLSTLTQI
jgi:hypothetical protein